MLELRAVAKRLGSIQLGPFDLEIPDGAYFVLLGPSGVGKTVLLEMVAGLTRPDSGTVWLGGEDLTRAPPEERGLAMVVQDHALFPHMSVLDNICYGLRARRVPRREARQRARETARLVHVEPLLDRRVHHLSGGEQQRVALARALVVRPRIMLLDEPLASLDTNIRLALRRELARIRKETDATFIHVSHDAEDALVLADRVGVMLDHRLRQVGTTDDVFEQPADPGVAAFLGMRNVLAVSESGPGRCRIEALEINAVDAGPSTSHVWIRPEDILLSDTAFESSARNQCGCTVEAWEPRGGLVMVTVRAEGVALEVAVTPESFARLGIQAGRALRCAFKSSAVRCF